MMGQDGAAQNLSEEGRPDALDFIKTQMLQAAQENKKLVTKNKALMAQLVGLQLDIARREEAIEAVKELRLFRQKIKIKQTND